MNELHVQTHITVSLLLNIIRKERLSPNYDFYYRFLWPFITNKDPRLELLSSNKLSREGLYDYTEYQVCSKELSALVKIFSVSACPSSAPLPAMPLLDKTLCKFRRMRLGCANNMHLVSGGGGGGELRSNGKDYKEGLHST